LKYSVKVP